ncbi:GLPGLI family protein [Elizabethkingia sp. JS20170427COW]|uniref:GLPGLI family protein n=1 Tax=Elizabethkingia sp. JS20170427COW TaxID=2583851 RepID=UPI001110EA87|nr:GLPGLI family protein [Elizabethkingia sp. JS20170427COW]QCX54404.1 GLPGLI family protein [Elizabethkingia sp. JS20170427COW]
MKKHITLFVMTWCVIVHSQMTIKVSYESISKPKINYNGFSFPESQKAEIERQILQNAKKPEKYILYYENGNSFFQRDPSENVHSTQQKTEYYRMRDKVGIYRLSDYIVEEFYGYYPMDNVSIEFSDETQVIENYTCKLALYKIGDTVNKVWYTEDIPVSAGPYNYYNVPGLILKVENPNLLCYAVNISKNVDKKDIKKMNNELEVYEGEELERKNGEGRQKMLGNSRQKADKLMKNIQNK